ncbi:MAG: tetratricopeptide repeat protein [Planctomycetota bacterium]
MNLVYRGQRRVAASGLALLVVSLLACAGSEEPAGPDGASTNSLAPGMASVGALESPPTFTADVAPILYQNCGVCHREGESAPFALWTYEDARRKRRQIVRVTRRGLMPPWLPESGHLAYENERGLTQEEIDTLQGWVEADAPEGDPADLPERPEFAARWQMGTPDLVLRLDRPFEVPADGPELFRNFLLEVPTEELRYVRAVEIRPGSPAAHHGILQLDLDRRSRSLAALDGSQGFGDMALGYSSPPDGHFLGWTPGKRPTLSPPAMAWRLWPGSDLVLQLHLTPTGKVEALQPEIGIYFTDEPPRRRPMSVLLYSEEIDIPPGESNFVLEDELRLPVDTDLVGLYPHAHYLCVEMLAEAQFPSGNRQTLLEIASWDFDWQDDYRLAEPLRLPAGTTVRFRYRYDNSGGNVANPSVPPKRVRFGQESSDEMGTLALTLVPRGSSEAELAGQVLALEEAVFLRAVQRKPYDWSGYRKLGRVLLDQREPSRAETVLREALRLRPDFADARVDLGSSLLAMGRLPEAREELMGALALEPMHALGRLQLARVLAAEGRLDAAVGEATEAVRLTPSLVDGHVFLGATLAQRGETRRALPHFEKALTLSPRSPQHHNNLATAHFELGHLELARDHYRQAVAGDPNHANAWLNLGRVLGALGDGAKSRAALDRARALGAR